jgi:hypothetical protein
MPAQVRYDQAILAGEFVKAESPISARADVAMQQGDHSNPGAN